MNSVFFKMMVKIFKTDSIFFKMMVKIFKMDSAFFRKVYHPRQ